MWEGGGRGPKIHSSGTGPVTFRSTVLALGGTSSDLGGMAQKCLPWRRACTDSKQISETFLQ